MSRPDILVTARHVSKKFCRDLKRSLRYGLADLAAELAARRSKGELRKAEFWANRDLSFEVRRGEVLGIIGDNGAGKTTLLRMMNGLIKPDAGSISIRGRMGALIALGAGFNPILTGRENIYINAAILGFSRRETDAMLAEIVDFSGIESFIDTPVKNYSSGMIVRLGFSVAAQLDPDVLLVDEVLAVGDYAFREKSFARMNEICNRGAAVVFISHNMAAVSTLCHRVLWLEKGRTRHLGPTEEVLNRYIAEQEEKSRQRLFSEYRRVEGASSPQALGLVIREIRLLNGKGIETRNFAPGEPFRLRIDYETRTPIADLHFVVHVCTQRETIFVSDMFLEETHVDLNAGDGHIDCEFADLPLIPNTYVAKVFVFGSTNLIKIVFPPKQVLFTVAPDPAGGTEPSIHKRRHRGVVQVASAWRIDDRPVPLPVRTPSCFRMETP